MRVSEVNTTLTDLAKKKKKPGGLNLNQNILPKRASAILPLIFGRVLI